MFCFVSLLFFFFVVRVFSLALYWAILLLPQLLDYIQLFIVCTHLPHLFGIHCHRFRLCIIFSSQQYSMLLFFIALYYIWASCHNCPKTARTHSRFFFDENLCLNVFYPVYPCIKSQDTTDNSQSLCSSTFCCCHSLNNSRLIALFPILCYNTMSIAYTQNVYISFGLITPAYICEILETFLL